MEDEEEGVDEFSAMAWEVAAQGKSGRDIATLHETWAALVVQSLRPDAFERAQVQQSIDRALSDYSQYNMVVFTDYCCCGAANSATLEFLNSSSRFRHQQGLSYVFG